MFVIVPAVKACGDQGSLQITRSSQRRKGRKEVIIILIIPVQIGIQSIYYGHCDARGVHDGVCQDAPQETPLAVEVGLGEGGRDLQMAFQKDLVEPPDEATIMQATAVALIEIVVTDAIRHSVLFW